MSQLSTAEITYGGIRSNNDVFTGFIIIREYYCNTVKGLCDRLENKDVTVASGLLHWVVCSFPIRLFW